MIFSYQAISFIFVAQTNMVLRCGSDEVIMGSDGVAEVTDQIWKWGITNGLRRHMYS